MNECDFQERIKREAEREKLARRILGVAEGDGPAGIKRAFWLLALECHPDKNPGDREAERRFQNIVNAYDFLNRGRRDRVVLTDEGGDRSSPSSKSRLENSWSYYVWWRSSFFDARYGATECRGGSPGGPRGFEEVEPERYEHWYETAEGRRIDAEEKSSLERLLGRGEGRRLLDIGCGTGHFTRWFASQGYRVVGLDRSQKFIGYAKYRDGALFVMADGSDIPFPNNSFQFATAITVMEFVRYPGRLLQEMYRVSECMMLLLILNPDSELNRERRKRKTGPFASARFWKPDRAKRYVQDMLSLTLRGKLHQEIHEDFCIIAVDK